MSTNIARVFLLLSIASVSLACDATSLERHQSWSILVDRKDGSSYAEGTLELIVGPRDPDDGLRVVRGMWEWSRPAQAYYAHLGYVYGTAFDSGRMVLRLGYAEEGTDHSVLLDGHFIGPDRTRFNGKWQAYGFAPVTIGYFQARME